MVQLVVFLGNPGVRYSRTRHNFAWMVLEEIEARLSLSWSRKFKGRLARRQVESKPLHLLKPETHVNKSGESANRAVEFFKLTPREVLVVHDELELPFGHIRIKMGGGLGGHNGLRSMKNTLNSGDFYRLRLGIGRPERGSVSSFVLGRFTPEEEAQLPELTAQAVDKLEHFLREN